MSTELMFDLKYIVWQYKILKSAEEQDYASKSLLNASFIPMLNSI